MKDYDQREMHAALRLKERYGLQLTAEFKKEIVRTIRKAKKELRRNLSGAKERPKHRRPRTRHAYPGMNSDPRRTRWHVYTSQGEVRLIFDHIDTVIVTFLPLISKRDF